MRFAVPLGLLWDKKRLLYILSRMMWIYGSLFCLLLIFSKNSVNITTDKPEAHP